MAHDAFVSYAAEDKPIADMICAVAERNGVRCWMAPRDIAPGADWRESILSAIRASQAMVLVFSAHANASKHVNREVDCGIEAGIPVVPFRTEDTMPSGSLEYSLYGVHWLDAVTPPLEAHATRLAELLKSIVANRGPVPQGPAVAREPRPPQPAPMPLAAASSPSSWAPRAAVSRNTMILASLAAAALIIVVWLAFRGGSSQTSGNTPATTPTAATGLGGTSTPAPPSTIAATPIPTSTTPPSRADPAANAAATNRVVMFQTPQAALLWTIKPDRVNDFEQTWGQIVDGLRRSDQPQARQLAHTINLFRIPSAATPAYVTRIDPAAPTVDYSPLQLLTSSGRFDRQGLEALYRRIYDSVIEFKPLSLEQVDFVPRGMALNPMPGPFNTSKPSGGDSYTFTVDQAEIWWEIKPGQREAFESAFREILPGLHRSNNPYVRQMARGLKTFHIAGDSQDIEVFRIDSVAKGMSYNPTILMQWSGTFSADTQTALAARMANAVARVSVLPLTPVR